MQFQLTVGNATINTTLPFLDMVGIEPTSGDISIYRAPPIGSNQLHTLFYLSIHVVPTHVFL